MTMYLKVQRTLTSQSQQSQPVPRPSVPTTASPPLFMMMAPLTALTPPAIIVIAQIEHIRSARLDRHRLGDRDVVDVRRDDLGKARPRAIGIVGDVQLDPGHAGGELRPVGRQRTQPKAGGINQVNRVRQ